MAHEIENRNGVYSFAYANGDEAWHRLGTNVPLERINDRDFWLKAAGHDFEVIKVPALASLEGPAFDHVPADQRFKKTDRVFLVRPDTQHVLGCATEGYQTVQPPGVDDWFWEYIAQDKRFGISASGTLNNGEKLWMTARFNGDMTVAGEAHSAYLLMSTSFDQTQATVNQATVTRTVCRNTMRVAHSDKRAVIKTTHRSKFDGARVHRELAQIAQSFDTYKAMGDAMACRPVTRQECATFVKNLLDIPLEANRVDVSTRKQNIAADLERAIGVTLNERNTRDPDAWCLLNGVTRYVDHERTVRGTDGSADGLIAGRFEAGLWGSGDDLKGKAVELLLPLIDFREKVLIPA